jgi:hypothetical protein
MGVSVNFERFGTRVHAYRIRFLDFPHFPTDVGIKYDADNINFLAREVIFVVVLMWSHGKLYALKFFFFAN